jgi:hypothetical protein
MLQMAAGLRFEGRASRRRHALNDSGHTVPLRNIGKTGANRPVGLPILGEIAADLISSQLAIAKFVQTTS